MTSETGIQARLERLLDRTEIFDLVRYERLCRDQRDFPAMIACYVPKALVRTTWFDGTIEEMDVEDWNEQWDEGALESAQAPEDWSGSVDVEATAEEGRVPESSGEDRELRASSIEGIDLSE